MQMTFEGATLPPPVTHELYRQNPWWRGRAMPPLPTFRRWPFGKLRERLLGPLAPILELRGPRQVGKTTLLEQLIETLLRHEGVAAERIFRVQFDELDWLRRVGSDPIPKLVSWFETVIFKGDLNEAARRGQPAFVFFDEVQNLENWAAQSKALVDHTAVQVMLTGSSALRIARGRDSLAGRIQTIEIGPLRLAEIAALRGTGPLPGFQPENGYEAWGNITFWRDLAAHGERHREQRDVTFALFAERGGYPLAHRADIGWEEIARQLVETVVERVIEHDLRIGERGRRRDPVLLREVFRLACRYTGQELHVRKLAEDIQTVQAGNVGAQRIRHYLDFLHQSLLVVLIDPLEIQLKRMRAPKKICLSDHALRAATLRELVPLVGDADPPTTALAGHVAEGILGAYLASMPSLGVAWRPERSGAPKIDYVLTVGDRRVPVEVKYQARIDPLRDTAALRRFLDELGPRAPLGLLVTRGEQPPVVDPRIVSLPLASLLLLR
ncbi:MAG: ATP-binding protein [Geminicoccaceae bacterium]|nr:ATP-binding protein [Geminicoccaceae bacterium]